MGNFLLKKQRNIRVFSGVFIGLITMLAFQNCGPQLTQCAEGGTTNTANCKTMDSAKGSTSSSSGSNGSSSGSVWGSGGGGGSIGSGGGFGGGAGGGGSSGGGGGSGGPILGGGGGGSGGGSTIPGGSTDTTFRITRQPASIAPLEEKSWQLDVSVLGGKTPYSYQWYKDNIPSTEFTANTSYMMGIGRSYKEEGTYHVIIRDATGASLKSSVARVLLQEPKVGCTAGSYFTFTSAQYDEGHDPRYFTEYFDSPRGKMLLHSSFDKNNVLYSLRSYSRLSDYSVPKNLQYLEKTFISCRTDVPRIHTPQQNPGYSFDSGINRFDDGNGYLYKGAIEFECRNKKLKLVANTCKWERDPNYDNGGGGGG